MSTPTTVDRLSHSPVTTRPADPHGISVKTEPSTTSRTESVKIPTGTTHPQQYQPLLPRTTPVSIRPLPMLSPYGLSPTAGPLSNFTGRMYRPSATTSREIQLDQAKGRKGRRKRTTPYQLAELMKVFQQNESPGYDAREDLTVKVGMTNREVQVWFQNRRAKEANRAKRVEQAEASNQEASAYRKMSVTSSESETSGAGSDGSSECVSLSTNTTSTVGSAGTASATVKPPSSTHRPIKMAPRKASFSSATPPLFSPYGRMAMAFAAPDGRMVLLQQPTIIQPPSGAPSAPAQGAQQQQQQPTPSCLQQPFQFLPSPFLPSPGVTPNFTAQPQVMLVPVIVPAASYPLNALGSCDPTATHRVSESKLPGADIVPRSVCYSTCETSAASQTVANKSTRSTEVTISVEAEKEKYAEAANVLASLATA